MGSDTVSSFTVSSCAPSPGKARPSPSPRAMATKIQRGSSRSRRDMRCRTALGAAAEDAVIVGFS